MSEKSPPYYVVKNGKGICAPSLKMRRNSFPGLDCGPDGPQARALARQWYARWLEVNKQLKFPSSSSEFGGHVVFTRTATHMSITYAPERSFNIIIPRISNGESFESIVIVRGNKEDVAYLHEHLASAKTKAGFGLSEEVLLEMRSAARAQRIVRAADDEAPYSPVRSPMPKGISGKVAAYTTDITDDQWRAISAILMARTPENQRPRLPKRETINGIVHHLRSGQPWTKLPDHMPNHHKVRVTYTSLVERGKWEKIEAVLKASSSHT